MEDLNGLPFLDAVVRETLRVYSPVMGTVRVAAKDDVIPLSRPFKDTKGLMQHELQWVICTFDEFRVLQTD